MKSARYLLLLVIFLVSFPVSADNLELFNLPLEETLETKTIMEELDSTFEYRVAVISIREGLQVTYPIEIIQSIYIMDEVPTTILKCLGGDPRLLGGI